MKRTLLAMSLAILMSGFTACKKAAPGNDYKVMFKALRQNTAPAVGFRVDAWVKGKSEPKTILTGEDGMANFTDLPRPDTQHQLMTVLHYYAGKKDQSREISYPFIPSDAERLKDTQYIPNTVTPEPQ